jgi:hypothetical protein
MSLCPACLSRSASVWDRLAAAQPSAWASRTQTTSLSIIKRGPLLTMPRLFAASVAGYVLGLCIAIAVSLSFDAAQPALLYILPCVTLAPFLRACMLGRAASWLSCSTVDEVPPTLPFASL